MDSNQKAYSRFVKERIAGGLSPYPTGIEAFVAGVAEGERPTKKQRKAWEKKARKQFRNLIYDVMYHGGSHRKGWCGYFHNIEQDLLETLKYGHIHGEEWFNREPWGWDVPGFEGTLDALEGLTIREEKAAGVSAVEREFTDRYWMERGVDSERERILELLRGKVCPGYLDTGDCEHQSCRTLVSLEQKIARVD